MNCSFRHAVVVLVASTAPGLSACFVLEAEPARSSETRLALYSVPMDLSETGGLLTLIGARVASSDEKVKDNFCLRLTAERGSVSEPGSSAAAGDGGLGAAAADAGGAAGCSAPRCVQVRFAEAAHGVVAYAIYAPAAGFPNDILVGAAYKGLTCTDQSTGELAARATLLLYPGRSDPSRPLEQDAGDDASLDSARDRSPNQDPSDGAGDSAPAGDALDGGAR